MKYILIKQYGGNHIHRLIITAHPDDEVVFADEKLDTNSFVLCLTNKSNQNKNAEFQSVLKMSGSQGEILDYPNAPWSSIMSKKRELAPHIWSSDHIDKCKIDIKKYIENYKPNEIYTHNIKGEYGHCEHKLVHEMVVDVYNNLQGFKPKLYFFFTDF